MTPGRNPNTPVALRPIPVRTSGRASASGGDEADRLWSDIFQQAPAWLVSASFHTFMLIVLAISAAVAVRTGKVEEVLISAERMRYSETIGNQADAPSTSQPIDNQNVSDDIADKLIKTAQNLTPVVDPFSAAPGAVDFMNFDGHWVVSDVDAPVIGLNNYSGREIGSRNTRLKDRDVGGNKTTEESVVLGLDWLARQQQPDGLWSLIGPYSDGATGRKCRAGGHRHGR